MDIREGINNEIAVSEEADAIAKREAFEENIHNIWGYTPLGLQAKQAAMSMLSTKTGLYAKVPITCKSSSCPYAITCPLLDAGLAPRGQKCPMETAMIETRYAGYSDDLGLDTASYIDNTIVADLINYDITIERCKSLLAANQTPIEEVVAVVGDDGEAYTKPEISKAWEVLERASNRRDKLLDSLMATRKAKKGMAEEESGIQQMFSQVYDQEFYVEEKPDYIDEENINISSEQK